LSRPLQPRAHSDFILNGDIEAHWMRDTVDRRYEWWPSQK
jgi:meiotically up-regulated gene 157 (Mug157) protein